MAGAPHPLLPSVGDVFAERYEVRRCLRAGGMGAVYEVRDRRTGWLRALKVLLPSLAADAGARERFVLEASATANLSCPSLVQVVDADVSTVDGCPYLVMELLEGEDLGAKLARDGALPLELALPLLRDVAVGLEALHAADVVHRDLKPENVFLRTDENGSRAVLIDLGVAKLVAEATLHAPTTLALGTPRYMSSEQVEGDGSINHRADLYALGQLTYTMCVGHAYFEAEARAGSLLRVLLQSGVREPASVRARQHGVSLSPAFDVWFDKATARRRAARFTSASEQIEALHRLSTAHPRGSGGDRRRFAAIGGAGIAVALAAASLAVASRPARSEAPLLSSPPTAASSPADADVPPLGAPIPVEPSPPVGAVAVPPRTAPLASSAIRPPVHLPSARVPPRHSSEVPPQVAPPADPSDVRR